MINDKLLSVLTQKERENIKKQEFIICECGYLISSYADDMYLPIVSGVKMVSKLADLRKKDLNYTAIQRINGIINLCLTGK